METISTRTTDSVKFELPKLGQLRLQIRIGYASEGDYSYELVGRDCYLRTASGSGTSIYKWQLAGALANVQATTN